jgi:outer membrane autotransporter protein
LLRIRAAGRRRMDRRRAATGTPDAARAIPKKQKGSGQLMNANTSSRTKALRVDRTPRVTPLTHAVRAALAISFTLFALGGSGAAIAAGTCVTTVPNTVSCNGDFTETLPGTVFAPVADLTLVVGDSLPSSVIPGAGFIGIDATWGGNVGVFSAAEITTAGADGIHAVGTTSALVTNSGSVSTDVTGSAAIAVNVVANGDAGVVNSGNINAYSTDVDDVTAVNVYTDTGNVTFDNQATGGITATAQDGNAIALNASAAAGIATFSNEGTITASSVNGIAIGALVSAYGDVGVTNSGNLSATSTNYQAVGLLASSATGIATVDSSGSINATGGQDQAIALEVFGQTGASVTSTGSISATSATGTATGILAQTVYGNATIDSSSGLSITSGYNAIGLSAISTNGDASASGSGFTQVIGHGGISHVIEAYSVNGNATASNNGFNLSGAYNGSAIGVSATSDNGTASASNNGYMQIIAKGDSSNYATAILAKTYNGDASASNSDTAQAYSSHGVAIGMKVDAAGGDALATNTGLVVGQNFLLADADGIRAVSSTGKATVENSGTAVAQSNQILGFPFSFTTVLGIGAQSYSGTTVTNSGIVEALGPWFVDGIKAIALYGDVGVTNTASGTVFANGLAPIGISASVGYGLSYHATVNNDGAVHVVQTGDCFCYGITPDGIGILATSNYAGGVQINNNATGSIAISTQHGATGISARTYNDTAAVNNAGSIAINSSSYISSSYGISAFSAYGSADVVNSGSVTLTGAPAPGLSPYTHNAMAGIYAKTGRHHDAGYGSGYYGALDTTITNSGDIDIHTSQGDGILGVAQYGSALVSNSGNIRIDNTFGGYGVVVQTGFNGLTTIGSAGIDNTGLVQVYGSQVARGLIARVSGGNTIDITNAGDVQIFSELGAAGVFARNYNYTGNAINVTNTGAIGAHIATGTLYAANAISNNNHAEAIGVRTYNYSGVTTVNNGGDIVATAATSNPLSSSAVGVYTKNGYATYYGDTVIANTGTITATDISSNGSPTFHAAHGAWGAGIAAVGTYGNFDISNAGSIVASAKSAYFDNNGLTTANGISVISKVGSVARTLTLGDISLINGATGSISVSAESSIGTGTTFASGLDGLVTVGSYGSGLVSAGHGITIDNEGQVAVQATTDAAATGSATAIGLSAVNGSAQGYAKVINNGIVSSHANSASVANATGVFAAASDITISLNAASNIVATATGASGVATGLSASGANIVASNAGFLGASFVGSGGTAYGAQLTSPAALAFTNTGNIVASADNAVGVNLVSTTATTLTNSGTISAVSSSGNGVAVLTGASSDTITNTGTITGTLQTGDGDDSFTNAIDGVWNAAGTSDFGAGDDSLSNAGTIHLNASTISFGSDSTVGNQFVNTGLITVVGTNAITMITGTSANPNTFTNNGMLNFQNGVVGDSLAITGNFAGNGTINMDVSRVHGTSDQLQIVGNVLAGSVNTVNVHVLDDPTAASTIIPLITVIGTSVADSFVLGTITQHESFLTLAYGDSLVSNIDASDKTADVFSLGVAVTGLSDLGTLAVSAAPGAQSLMGSQIGTLQQRMGAVSQTIKGGVSLWARVFQDSGTVDPSHNASNFSQGGNFAFDQNNSGEEVGVDFAFTDELKAGLLVAKDQASQHLDGSDSGSSQIKGTTGGVYATWISSTGAYLDASFRSMSFTSQLKSVAGEAWVKGDADAFNVEAGKSWTLGNGLKIAPQLQYTWNQVNSVKSVSATLAGFQSGGDNSSRGRLGVMVSKSYTADAGTTWTPYVGVSAVHEFDGTNRYTINNTFSGETSTQGTSALIEGGVNVKIRNLSLHGGASWQDGGAMKSFFGGQVGLRYTW